jgi:hypothetical protein
MSSDSSCSSPLERYVGSWRGEVTLEAAGSEPQRYTQENSFAWILGGRFLEERGTDSNGGSFLGVWSLDPGRGTYRAHYFIAPAGDIVVLTHEWNERSQSFIGSAELGGGVRMLAEDRFIDRNTYEWRIAVQDGTGTLLSRLHGLERRANP